MLFKVVRESMCFNCKIQDDCCKLEDIPEEEVFQNLGNKKLYAFVHDSAECGGLIEVEPC